MVTIYHASGLFKAPDQLYNLLLTNKLEDKGYKVILPQRDGFEFSKLADSLGKFLSPELVPDAVNRIIYFLDKGKFIGKDSDICIARLDEPIDEGVDNEIGFCRMNDIPIIGFRTDVRSPYGSANNEVSGAHFFPPYSCNKFILIPPNFKTILDVGESLDKLVSEIDRSITPLIPKSKPYSLPTYVNSVKLLAERLFADIYDIHSEEGLIEIAKRYNINKDSIGDILPEIKRI